MDLAVGNLMLLGALPIWIRPLGVVGLGALAVVGALFAVIFLLRWLLPKLAAIASTTAKEAMSQPFFYVLIGLGVVLIFLFLILPYNTLGEDVKMVKSEGLTLIKLLAIMLAVWTASVSVANEIEGRTALTILSKPISRRQLILGKFVGVLIPVAIIFIILGAFFLGGVSYKVAYDAKESSNPDPTTMECYEEIVQVVPGLALGFMEAAVLASISVAISTRLSMIPNLVICISIYVLGHLVPLLVNSAVGEIVFVQFVGDLSAAVLPVLDHFNMDTAISTGQHVSMGYLAMTGAYSLAYCTVAMLLALLLFEDRDLA
jgi:ABC-type Na+ efflux pump permease subunit